MGWLSMAVVTALVCVVPAARQFLGQFRRPIKAFQAAGERMGAVAPRSLGVREIPVACVVGSVGRWQELAGDFRPRRWRWDKGDDERYRGIETALRRGVTLPPIVVYLVDGEYYVLDGHHRVAAARALGQAFIDAEVTEYRRVTRLTIVEAHASCPEPIDREMCAPGNLAEAA